jgi:hypothetical protein
MESPNNSDKETCGNKKDDDQDIGAAAFDDVADGASVWLRTSRRLCKFAVR